MSTKNIIRAFLVLLILLNVWMIFALSSESAELSGETSGRVTTFVAQIVVKDFKEKTPVEQAEIIESLHPYVRSAAHMTEFGLLGAWVMLLLLTYHVRPLFSGLQNTVRYRSLYEEYKALCRYFGKENNVMKRLKNL